jgi:hypothetical protein
MATDFNTGPIRVSLNYILQISLYYSIHKVFSSQHLVQNWTANSKSKLLYDWRFTATQFVLAPSPLRLASRFFFQLNPCGHSPYVTSCLTRRWVCFLWIFLTFRRVYVSHIKHVTGNSSLCTIYKASVSIRFAKQIIPILCILCYNGGLVTWTVVRLTFTKFKPLIFSMSGFTLSYTANMSITMILYDFCFLPAYFFCIIVYVRKVESCMQIADRFAPCKISSDAENLAFWALQF